MVAASYPADTPNNIGFGCRYAAHRINLKLRPELETCSPENARRAAGPAKGPRRVARWEEVLDLDVHRLEEPVLVDGFAEVVATVLGCCTKG